MFHFSRKLKEKRKKEQLENIRKKKERKEQHREKSMEGIKRKRQMENKQNAEAGNMSSGRHNNQ